MLVRKKQLKLNFSSPVQTTLRPSNKECKLWKPFELQMTLKANQDINEVQTLNVVESVEESTR